MSERFLRRERLANKREIGFVLKSANSVQQDPFSLKWRAYREEHKKPTPRLAVIVARRNVRHAVNRNRAKRLVKEFFRLHKKEFSTVVDCVVTIRKDKAMAYQEAEVALLALFKKARIL